MAQHDDFILALDFGGTKLTAAVAAVETLAARQAVWTALDRIYTPKDVDAADELRTMIAMSEGLLGKKRPLAVGVSFGGPVDFSAGVVRRSDHVPGWQNMPLQSKLESEFACRVHLDNDANAGALGEARLGAGSGRPDLCYLTISTGVGGGLILNGQVWRGVNGMAGEIGHMVVDPAGPLCLCGKHGCVERLASGPYMSRDAQQMLAFSPQKGSILRDLCAGKPVTGELLAHAAEAGDDVASEILLRGADAVGTAVGNCANLLDIPCFILGGGVTGAGDLWWDALGKRARVTALSDIEFEILPAALGDEAPLWGAAFLAFEGEA